MLVAKMLYKGSKETMASRIREGKVDFHNRFNHLSPHARAFIKSLLVADPAFRPDAAEALAHPWLRRHASAEAAAALEELAPGSRAATPGFRYHVQTLVSSCFSGVAHCLSDASLPRYRGRAI